MGSAREVAPFDPVAVRGMFDRMSDSYAWMSLALSCGFTRAWRARLMREIGPLPRGAHVADLMTGMGELWPHVLRAAPAARITALDFSPAMLARARAANASRFHGRVRIAEADALATGLPGHRFDAVVCAFGLKTLDGAGRRRLAAETVRLLAPGGRFGFVEVTEPPNRAFRLAYRLHLGRVVPAVGLLAPATRAEYRMLGPYVRAFGHGGDVDAAFTHPALDTRRIDLLGGAAAIWIGTRRG